MSDLFSGIANFTKSVSSTLNSYEMRKIGDKVQGYVMNFTEAEAKVREATNEDPWGPTGPQMLELAGMTFQYDVFPEIMGMLWKRMFYENKIAWRRVYKSLILLNYLLKNGSERVISTSRDHLFELRALESYKCFDERGKDEGVNVRHRVKLVIDLLQDDEQLRVERRKAKTETREKYQGFSKDEMLYKSGGKVSTFENWNAKSTSSNCSDKFSSSNNADSFTNTTTVTAFDFAEGRTHSPELGIPDRAQEALDNVDDEFGDFSEARSHQSNNKGVNFVDAALFSDNAISSQIPTIAPPKSACQKSSAQNDVKNDLFSLTNDVSAASNLSTPASMDLFQTVSTNFSNGNNAMSETNLATVSSVMFAVPSPPMLPQQNNVFDDIFGGAVKSVAAPDVKAPANNSSNACSGELDLFGTAVTINSNNVCSKLPQSNISELTDEFSAFGFFNSDGNGALRSQSGTTGVASLLDGLDFCGEMVTATPVGTSVTTITAQRQQQPHKSSAAISAPASSKILPKTWEDLKGKVNIDFDNLSLRPSPSKPTPTLNELQSQKSSNNNSLW